MAAEANDSTDANTNANANASASANANHDSIRTYLSDSSIVVFDCETDCGFERMCGYTRDAFVRQVMQFTCVCALEIPASAVWEESASDPDAQKALSLATKHTFWRDHAAEGQTPVHDLLALFDRAVLIVGYNVFHFDFPLLWRFYKNTDDVTATQRYYAHRAKTLDVMARVRDATGRYLKLDYLLYNNSLPQKTGSAADAPRLWEDDKRDELEAYCAADVQLTARLALQDALTVDDDVTLPNAVHGMRSALIAQISHAALRAP